MQFQSYTGCISSFCRRHCAQLKSIMEPIGRETGMKNILNVTGTQFCLIKPDFIDSNNHMGQIRAFKKRLYASGESLLGFTYD